METTPTNTHSDYAIETPDTPDNYALSAEATASRRSIHTPLDRQPTRDLLNSIRRGTPASGARRKNAPTPHATAVRQALNQRRTAMFTPGKNKRRSLREQRETPMDLLRNLGRVLAPATDAIASSTTSTPQKEAQSTNSMFEEDKYDDFDDDDDLTINRPRLSLGLDDDGFDDDDLRPPRPSILDDENFTVQSIEMPRRIVNERRDSRMSRDSIGSIRMDHFANDPTDTLGQQSDFFPGFLEELQTRANEATDDFDLERVDDDPADRMGRGRESDFGLRMPEGLDDQTTFFLSEPLGDATQLGRSRTGSVADVSAGGPDFQVVLGTEDDPDVPMSERSDINGILQLPVNNIAIDKPDKLPGISRRPTKRVSRHGIEYPPLPAPFVKKIAQNMLLSSGLSNHKISAETLTALTQASEWFFEQLGDDLGAYAQHAKRKTIEESDVATIMRRQRQVGGQATLFSLAQKHMSRELLQELRMPIPKPLKQRGAHHRAKRDQAVSADNT